jgi:hypothetical protein
VFSGGEAKNEFLNRNYRNLVAHVTGLVTFKLFYAQIRQNFKLFEAKFWEFSEPSFGAASWGLTGQLEGGPCMRESARFYIIGLGGTL